MGRARIFFLHMVSEQVNLMHETPAYRKIEKNTKSLHPTVYCSYRPCEITVIYSDMIAFACPRFVSQPVLYN